MEASVAIVQLRQSGLSDEVSPSPHHYDVIVLDEPSKPSTSYAIRNSDQQSYITTRSTVGSHSVGKSVITLPSFKITDASLSLSEAVLANLSTKTVISFRRAVPVPLFDDRPSTREQPQPGTVLMCAPALPKDRIQYPHGRLENLARLVHMCTNTPELLDVPTRHMLIRIDEWLSHSQRVNPHFLASLFVCPPSRSRVIRCAHNPAYVEDLDKCLRCLGGSAMSVASSVDLDDSVRIGNAARVEMMTYDKLAILVINPLFKWTPIKEDQVPTYFAAGRGSNGGPSSAGSQNSNRDNYAIQYPLHRAALTGDHKKIESLIALNMDVNALDGDSWSPLHYACFFGHLKAVHTLLTTGNAKVNATNRGGSTALHMAAIHGSVYLVELLLSHADIDKEIRNNEGRTAMDLCASMPKENHQEIAELLRSWKKLDKIQVDFVSAGSSMVKLTDGAQTTVKAALRQIGAEYKFSNSALEIFSLWIRSESLSLQLKPDHLVLNHLNKKKWNQNLSKWTDSPTGNEVPTLEFRRNAHASLDAEITANLNDRALCLLYDEARTHFLEGKYVCKKEEKVAMLSSIIWKTLHGDGVRVGGKEDLSLILPSHLNVVENAKDWIDRLNHALKKSESSNTSKLQRQFLAVCQQFRFYGSTFFAAERYDQRAYVAPERVWCGVNDCGVHLISRSRHAVIASYEYIGLTWDQPAGTDYLQLRARAHNEEITLRTKQAGHISSLLTKLRALNQPV